MNPQVPVASSSPFRKERPSNVTFMSAEQNLLLGQLKTTGVSLDLKVSVLLGRMLNEHEIPREYGYLEAYHITSPRTLEERMGRSFVFMATRHVHETYNQYFSREGARARTGLLCEVDVPGQRIVSQKSLTMNPGSGKWCGGGTCIPFYDRGKDEPGPRHPLGVRAKVRLVLPHAEPMSNLKGCPRAPWSFGHGHLVATQDWNVGVPVNFSAKQPCVLSVSTDAFETAAPLTHT